MLNGKQAYYFCKLCLIPIGTILQWHNHTETLEHKENYKSRTRESQCTDEFSVSSCLAPENYRNYCLTCEGYFNSTAAFKQHLLDPSHRECEIRKEIDDGNGLRQGGGEFPNVYYCDLCEITFQNTPAEHKLTEQHSVLVSETEQCYFCPKRYVPSMLVSHIDEIHVNHVFKCLKCTVKFISVDKMVNHVRDHLTEVQKEHYTDRDVLKLGLFKIPDDLRKIECKRCVKACFLAQDSTEPNSHVLTDHQEVQLRNIPYSLMYGCRICDSEFSLEKDMNDHIEGHKMEIRQEQENLTVKRIVKEASLSPVIIRHDDIYSPTRDSFNTARSRSRSKSRNQVRSRSVERTAHHSSKARSPNRLRRSRTPESRRRSGDSRRSPLRARYGGSSYSNVGRKYDGNQGERFKGGRRSPHDNRSVIRNSYFKYKQSPEREPDFSLREIHSVKQEDSSRSRNMSGRRQPRARKVSISKARSSSPENMIITTARRSRTRSNSREIRLVRSRSRSKSPVKESPQKSPKKGVSKDMQKRIRDLLERSHMQDNMKKGLKESVSIKDRLGSRSNPETTDIQGIPYPPPQTSSYTTPPVQIYPSSTMFSYPPPPFTPQQGTSLLKGLRGAHEKEAAKEESINRKLAESSLLNKLKRKATDEDLRKVIDEKKVKMLDSRPEGVKAEKGSTAVKDEELCPICWNQFAGMDSLLQHLKSFHSSNMFGCKLCQTLGWSLEILLKHITDTHDKTVSLTAVLQHHTRVPERLERINCRLCPPPYRLGAGGFWLCADLLSCSPEIEKHFNEVHGITDQVQLLAT